jgi:hypothetical protein
MILLGIKACSHGMCCCWSKCCRWRALPSHCITGRRPGGREDGPGEITLTGGLQYLVIEGVGASQASVRDELDVAIWVETDEPTRLGRDTVRVAAGEIDFEHYLSWMADENAYAVAQRPWQRADLLVYGGDSISHNPKTEVVVAQVPGAR